MNECYLGIDIGSISTKGVLLDKDDKVIASAYIWTEGNPTQATKKVITQLREQIDSNYVLKGIGTTGSARKLIGLMLDATVVKNEITAHAIGTLSRHKDVRTILEIGGQDSKIIFLENGIITDDSMNTLCAAGTGSFLSSQAKRLGVEIEDFGDVALQSKNPVKIAARCTVFAESDLIHKAQAGYRKEDIIAGLCRSIVLNYLNNVAKGKKIHGPIVFQGGVSKNKGVVHYFEEQLQEPIFVDEEGHLMGAIGVSILAHKSSKQKEYTWDMKDIAFETKGYECKGCSNHCELLKIYKDGNLIDTWGSRCGKF